MIAEALGSAITLGLVALAGTLIVEVARRKAKIRGDDSFISPLSGKMLMTGAEDATKRCRYCSEEASMEAAKRTHAYD